MPTNEFLPFATGIGANVLSQADYAALGSRGTGFVAGTALSAPFNKAVRQSSVMAAMVAQFGLDIMGVDVPDDGDIDTVLDIYKAAIRSQRLNYVALVGGTENALTATLSPPLAAYVAGIPLRVLVAANNTGAATLNVNGLGALPIVSPRGVAISAGDLSSGAVVTLICTGTAWMMASPVYSDFPLVLTADKTIWVRTDGSDSNDGSANTPGAALATISAAIAIAQRYVGTYTITIQLGVAGTYAPPSFTISRLGCPLKILGSTGSPSSFLISGISSNNSVIHAINSNVDIQLQGIFLHVPEGVNNINLRAAYGARVACTYVGFTVLGSSGTRNIGVLAEHLSYITIGTGCLLSGEAAAAIYCNGGRVLHEGEFTVVGTPNFSIAFIYAQHGGQFLRDVSNPVFSGGATGTRYSINSLSLCASNGGGGAYIPGNAAGTTGTGGLYL